MRAYNAAGNGEWSEVATMVTAKELPPPPPVPIGALPGALTTIDIADILKVCDGT